MGQRVLNLRASQVVRQYVARFSVRFYCCSSKVGEMIGPGGDGVRIARPLFPEEGDGSIPISPLQLILTDIPPVLAMELNALWHSVLPKTHLGNIVGSRYAVSYGAEFANRYYAVAIWTHPPAANRMKDSDTTIELRRLAIAPDAPRNTASRLLSIMRRDLLQRFPDITRMISYQSKEHHHGTIYKASGWKASADVAFMEWGDRADSTRAGSQITSDKVRWELRLA